MTLNIYKHNLGSLCVLLLCLVACQSRAVNPNPQPDLSFSNEGLIGYEKLAIQPEDLGWPSVSYSFFDAPEWRSHIKAEQSYETLLSSFYNPADPETGVLLVHDLYGFGQSLEVFKNEAIAVENFEKEFESGTIKLWGERPELSPRFQPQIENVYYGCRAMMEGQGCNVVMQYGRFMTNAGMLVDGQTSTLEDWENAMIAMQARLIAYAEEEQNNQ